MIEKELLEALIPAIEEIDGGCSYCISEFIEAANRGLEEKGFSLRIIFAGEFHESLAIEIIEASA